jgi:hypothetical protein
VTIRRTLRIDRQAGDGARRSALSRSSAATDSRAGGTVACVVQERGVRGGASGSRTRARRGW